MRPMQIYPSQAASIYQQAIKSGQAGSSEKAVIIYLREVLDHRLQLLRQHFPERTLHAVAIKTCSHPKVLRYVVESGYGLEAASFEEVQLARAAGARPERIVFDSPVKTRAEIQYCHDHLPGMLLNANNLAELDRYPSAFSGRLGLRINPIVANDAPQLFDVSRANSKFGVPITQWEDILEAAGRYPQITALHMHIGSNIRNFENNLTAIRKVLALAREINTRRSKGHNDQPIDTIDIGGGIDFSLDDEAFSVSTFVGALEAMEGLLDGYQLVTEYGTFVYKDSAFVASRIEYVTPPTEETPGTVYLHVGADLFLRKVYSNLPIHYPCSVIRRCGTDATATYQVVGPLCFAGDVLYPEIELPVVQEGDIFLIHNAGANTISMWSQHCSRTPPATILI